MATHAPLPLSAIEQLIGGAAALRAAATTGVLERLGAAPGEPEELAAAMGVDARLLRALLRALAATGIITAQADGAYQARPETARVAALMDEVFARLEGALLGENREGSFDSLQGAGARYPEIVPLLAEWQAEVADAVAGLLARPGLRVLDAGAGGAPWSSALVRREPTCAVVALDLPEVLPATRQAIERAGVAERFTLTGGDVFTAELEPAYDLVLAGNLCHLFAPEVAAALLGRLSRALLPGGTLAVLDIPGDPDVLADPETAVYALSLALRTSQGGLHIRAAYLEWLEAAGLVGCQSRRIEGAAVTLFTGCRKRAEPAA